MNCTVQMRWTAAVAVAVSFSGFCQCAVCGVGHSLHAGRSRDPTLPGYHPPNVRSLIAERNNPIPQSGTVWPSQRCVASTGTLRVEEGCLGDAVTADRSSRARSTAWATARSGLAGIPLALIERRRMRTIFPHPRSDERVARVDNSKHAPSCVLQLTTVSWCWTRRRRAGGNRAGQYDDFCSGVEPTCAAEVECNMVAIAFHDRAVGVGVHTRYVHRHVLVRKLMQSTFKNTAVEIFVMSWSRISESQSEDFKGTRLRANADRSLCWLCGPALSPISPARVVLSTCRVRRAVY